MKIGVYSEKSAALGGTSIWETPSGELVTCTVVTDAPGSIAWDDKVILGPVRRCVRTCPKAAAAQTAANMVEEPAPTRRRLLSRLFG